MTQRQDISGTDREPTDPLRIAVVAPPFYEVPPRGYGGTELICSLLVEGLVDRGHDVTLVGAGAAKTRARFLQTFDEPQPEDSATNAAIQVIHAARGASLLEAVETDVVHDHTLAGPLTAGFRTSPTVATVHGALQGPDSQADVVRAIGHWTPLIAISAAQRSDAPDLNWAATVHNGIDVGAYPFVESKDDFVLFLGRVSPHKGVDVAIKCAAAAGHRLVLAGDSTVPSERSYVQRLRRQFGGSVEWLGEVNQDEKKALLSHAICLLFPARWHEPFGLVMVEALACGTPVVALRAGSVPEILIDGVTGIVRDQVPELPSAIDAAERLDPAACRADAYQRFSASRMVEAYERVYRRVINGPAI